MSGKGKPITEGFNPDELLSVGVLDRYKDATPGIIVTVLSGTYREKSVTIKEIAYEDGVSEDNEKEFASDVMTMDKYRHEAIVNFIGAMYSPEKQTIVAEVWQHCSLPQAMEKNPRVFNEFMKAKCLLNISSAMSYLHGEGIMHGGLKPQNVAIVSVNPTDPVVAKLTDFETKCAGKRINAVLATGIGKDPYMAPEIIGRKGTYDKSIDVYSFSMLMYYIYSGQHPTEDESLAKGGDLYEKIVSGKRPAIPFPCSKGIGRLMQLCWNANPSKRPSFDQILIFLDDYVKDCKTGGKEGALARQEAGALLPKVEKEKVYWGNNADSDLYQFCELLRTNAISTKELCISCLNTIVCKLLNYQVMSAMNRQRYRN